MDMSADNAWSRLREVFEVAAELPAPAREAYLNEACAGNPALRAEVDAYLAADAEAEGLLDAPLDDLLDGLHVEDSAPAGAFGDGADEPGAEYGQGSQIGPYRLYEVLGEGGMGSVYRAVQTDPVQREVALKIIKPGMDSREVVARFESERQALAVMDHTSIAKVLDGGSTETGRPYFVMELVRGLPIHDYCDTHKLGTNARIELFASVCEAVQHAHQKGVIHRDLKPNNVLVTVQDALPVPKVIDFGVAKAVASSLTDKTLVTSIGQVLGTPAYMSPEQAERTGLDVDTRTDVYSLGVMLYELLAGALPYDRDLFRRPDFMVQYLLREKEVPRPSARLHSLADTQETVARNRRTDVRTLRRELSGDLDWIVMKAMEKDRTRRYGTVAELGGDLRRYLASETVLARPPSAAYRFRKFARRHRGALAASVAVAVSLGAGAALSTIGFVRADRSAALAGRSAERAEAVTDFLTSMLRAADPVTGSGPGTTVEEVLDAASEEVSAGALSDRPAVEIAVRRSIGGTYMLLGLLDRAAEHLEAAAALLDRTPGASGLERVTVLDELGQLRRRQGDAEAAERHYRDALALADSLGFTVDAGAGETLVNRIRNDLGLALRDMDRNDDAAAILEALAASERRLLAGDDVNLATTLNNLALVKRAQGDFDGAIRLFEETLQVLTAAFGERHVYVAAVLESIGSLEQRVGRYQEARDLMSRAHAMREELLGERHPDIVNGLNGLGLLHVDMGRFDEAEAYLGEGLEMSIDLLGEGHPRTGAILNSLGLLHMRRGDAASAEASLRRSVEIRDLALGPRHRTTLNTSSNLAAALLLGGSGTEAEALARRVVETEREIGLDEPTMLGSALRTWGRALTALTRFEEAEPPLLEAYRLQERELGAEHPQSQDGLRALAELYDAWGRDADAAEWRSRITPD